MTTPTTIAELIEWAANHGFGLTFLPSHNGIDDGSNYTIGWCDRMGGEDIAWTSDRTEQAILDAIPEVVEVLLDRAARRQEFRLQNTPENE